MVKVVCLFKKKAGLSDEEFRDYYENNHLKLFEKYLKLPGIERHVRRYLTPIKDPITGVVRPSPFNVILEVWFKDRALYEYYYQGELDAEFRQIVVEDEEKFFDRDQMFTHIVDEYDTELPQHPDAA